MQVSCRVRAVVAMVAMVGLAALTLTACTVDTPGTGTRLSTSSSTSPSPTPTSAVPKIGFSDCTKLISPTKLGVPAARAKNLTLSCGKAAVPVDYAQPGGPTVSLYVLKVHDNTSTGQKPLIVNPGGPGGSGVTLAVSLAASVSDAVLASYDLVGIDPRGVGLSSPITCLDDKTKDTIFSEAPDVRTPAGLAQADSIAQTWVTGCEAKAGAALGDYNTVFAAQDMDLVRQSLGATTLDYLGFSYGTLLGAVYAHLYPATVGAMVLDGAIDPGLGFQAGAETQAAGFESAFGQFAADCLTRSDCAPMGNPTTAVTQLAATATANGGIPSSNTADTRKATAGVVYSAVASALYDASEWPALGDAIIAAQKGDGKGLLALADEYYGRDSSGRYTNLIDAFTVVTCNDEGISFTDAQLTALGTDWAAKYPVFGAYFAGQMAMCNGWPASGHPVPTSVAAPGSKPILVVGTVHDPATPYANSAALVASLGTGVLLSWDGQGHTAYTKSKCIDQAVDAYLIGGTTPAPSTTCPA